MKKIFFVVMLFTMFFLASCNSSDELTLIFDSNGGVQIGDEIFTKDTDYAFPSEPTKEGYTFGGWYFDNDTFLQEVTQASLEVYSEGKEVTIFARWEEDIYSLAYISAGDPFIFYDSYGGTVVALDSRNHLYIWGNTETFLETKYELSPMDITDLIPLNSNESIIDVSIGQQYMMLLTDTHRVLAWGMNNSGVLGDGTTVSSYIPIDITNMFSLASGDYISNITIDGISSFAISSSNRVFAWGYNRSGDLGDGTNQRRSTPTEITNQFNLASGDVVEKIYNHYDMSFATTKNGKVYSWGRNEIGQLGDGSFDSRNTPLEITSQFDLGENEFISDIKPGSAHVIFLSNIGNVYTCGYNAYGQLGFEAPMGSSQIPVSITDQFYLPENEVIIQVSTNASTSLALTNNSRVFAWGDNNEGLIGNGLTGQNVVPVDITDFLNLMEGESVLSVLSGMQFALINTSFGRMITWGVNNSGELGDSTRSYAEMPIEINIEDVINDEEEVVSVQSHFDRTMILTNMNNLYIWGSNYSGQIGNGTRINQFTPINLKNRLSLVDSESIIQIEMTYDSIYVLTSNGRLFSWGSNNQGILGNGLTGGPTVPSEITPLFNLNAGEKIETVVTNSNYSYAITSMNRIFSWGVNTVGELGNGTLDSSLVPQDITSQFPISEGENIEKIITGNSSSFAFSSTGNIYAWGYNVNDQLLDGTHENHLSPVRIDQLIGASLSSDIVSVCFLGSHTIILTSDGHVYSSSEAEMLVPISSTIVGSFRDITEAFNLHENETILDIIDYRFVVVTSENRYILFSHYNHIFGTDSSNSDLRAINLTEYFSFEASETIERFFENKALTSDGRLFGWGQNGPNQLLDMSSRLPHPSNPDAVVIYPSVDFSISTGISLMTPTKDGYTFVGWYKDFELTIPFNTSGIVYEDTILYAKWSLAE